MSSLRQRELGRLLGCGWIKQALFIGPLLLCSALIRGCVWDCSLKCLRDLLTPRRREPLRPHTGPLRAPQRRTGEDADTLTVHMLSLWLLRFISVLIWKENVLPLLFTFASVFAHGVSLSRFFFFSLLLGFSHQPPALPSLCPYTHSENNVLAPALCFSMVLALECVPVKGDIYLLSAERERRPSLLRDTDRRGKVEQQFPEALFNSLASGCRGTIGCFIQWRLPLVNLTTAWQQKAVGSMQESVVVVLREWVW